MEVSILFCGILVFLQVIRRILKPTIHKKTDKCPNGPRSLGILGNIFTLRRLQIQPERELMGIARKWKDTCMLWAGQFPILIVNKPQAAKELLVEVRYSSIYHLMQPSYSS
jgi:hypothetical protein